MNDFNESLAATNAPPSRTDDPADSSNSSVFPGDPVRSAQAPELMQRVVRGAHETIDRFADAAAPRVQQWDDRAADAEAALQARTNRLLETGEAWSDKLRSTVHTHPLAALAAAVSLGALIARIAR